MKSIQKDLESIDIYFDKYTYESTIVANKSIEDVFIRGGVPVFNLEEQKPRERKDSVIP